MQSTTKIAFIPLFFFLSINVFAQENSLPSSEQKIAQIIEANIDWKKLKDSTAIYTFCLKIDFKNKKGKMDIVTKINNPEVSSIFKGDDQLKKYNYSGFITSKKGLLFRFYIIITDSKSEKQSVNIYEIPEATKYLLFKNENNYQDMGIWTFQRDNKVYH